MFGFLFARVGGDDSAAEDLLQETLLEAVRGASAFRAEASASTWMCAIARRRLARYYESERKAEMARRSLSLVHDGPGPDRARRRHSRTSRRGGEGPRSPARLAAPGPGAQVPGGHVRH